LAILNKLIERISSVPAGPSPPSPSPTIAHYTPPAPVPHSLPQTATPIPLKTSVHPALIVAMIATVIVMSVLMVIGFVVIASMNRKLRRRARQIS
jgi:hypothetical protein